EDRELLNAHFLAFPDDPCHRSPSAMAGIKQRSQILMLARRLRAEDGVDFIEEKGDLFLLQEPKHRRDAGIDRGQRRRNDPLDHFENPGLPRYWLRRFHDEPR